MSNTPQEPQVIDVGPRKRRRLKIGIIIAAVVLLLSFSRIVSIYISALWFESLGYSSVYWYIFKVKLALFFGSAILTAGLLSATFLIFQKLFGAYAFEKRTIVLNNQPFQFSPAKVIRPLGWIISALFGLIFGFKLKEHWRQFALYWRTLVWDHAPGALLLTEAGGSVTHLDGTPYRPTRSKTGLLLAQNPLIMRPLLGLTTATEH